jgi:hypothetical protein
VGEEIIEGKTEKKYRGNEVCIGIKGLKLIQIETV